MAQHDGVLNFLTKIDSSGFKKGLDGIGGIAKAGIGMTTKVLQGATAGLTALGGAAIKVGSDFEAGMSQVQAISGASGEDLEKLKIRLKKWGLPLNSAQLNQRKPLIIWLWLAGKPKICLAVLKV